VAVGDAEQSSVSSSARSRQVSRQVPTVAHRPRSDGTAGPSAAGAVDPNPATRDATDTASGTTDDG
jgi:hypothetical protein